MVFAYIFEIAFLVFLALGIIFSFLLNNLILHSITIFIFGVIAATFQKFRKTDLNFPYVFLIVGFVLGYILATTTGSRFMIIILFFLGVIFGLALKKIIKKYVETRK